MAESNAPRKSIHVLAESVRVERARRQWSQADVAEKAGTTADRIGQIESGSVDPRLSTVERVTEALGITLTIGEHAA